MARVGPPEHRRQGRSGRSDGVRRGAHSRVRLETGYGAVPAGGVDAHQLGSQAQFTYYVLNDFGPFIGWLGVVVAAGAVAYLSLREKALATWLGIISLLPVAAVVLMSLGLTVAGFPGIVGPIWMVVAFAGLALGEHQLFVTER